MLIEFRVENHRSIRDEQALTMRAGRVGAPDDPRPRTVPGDKAGMLPVAALYGANASGKSNLLAAIEFMRQGIVHSHRHWAPDAGIPRAPFAWGSKTSEPSLFDDFLAYDEVWCAFDRDQHERFEDACQMARGNQLELAVSNPCFELWLLLHFRESPGAQHRRHVQQKLEKFLPGYDKHFDFELVADRVDHAVRRARRLDQEATRMGEPFRNPTAGAYRLIESIARVEPPARAPIPPRRLPKSGRREPPRDGQERPGDTGYGAGASRAPMSGPPPWGRSLPS